MQTPILFKNKFQGSIIFFLYWHGTPFYKKGYLTYSGLFKIVQNLQVQSTNNLNIFPIFYT